MTPRAIDGGEPVTLTVPGPKRNEFASAVATTIASTASTATQSAAPDRGETGKALVHALDVGEVLRAAGGPLVPNERSPAKEIDLHGSE